MTNQTIINLLNHLAQEARNSVHDGSAGPLCLKTSKSTMDGMLSLIDDALELLSAGAPAFGVEDVAHQFALVLCLSEIIHLVNLSWGSQTRRLILQSPGTPLIGRQQRRAVAQIFMRLLEAVLRLGGTGETRISVLPDSNQDGARIEIVPPDSATALRVTAWLNADADQVNLQTTEEAMYGLTTLVAGKRLRALGGAALFESDAGSGATLEISLPWQPDGREECQPEPSLSSQPAWSQSALNVLVAEDCDDSFLLAGILLEKEFVFRARNGREALDMMKARRFDVVFMDIHMPDLDGYQTIRSMRTWEMETGTARTPIVILSSDDLDTQRRSADRASLSGLWRKPLDDRDLLELLNRLRSL